MNQGEALLAVQDVDTVIDQIRHRIATLPERAELAAVRAALDALAAERKAAVVTRDELAAKQAALEADLAGVEARIAEVDKRLYSGTVTASRDLQSMATDVEHLKERQSSLEDALLEVLEAREPVDAHLADLDDRAGAHLATASRLTAQIAEREAELGAELAAEQAKRAEAAASVPAELVARYEQLRSRLGGVGAARLVSGSCTGCHLTLSATEVDRLKRLPPDELVTCEQCGRILVR